MTRFLIEPEIFERYSGVMVGLIVVQGLNNRDGDPAIHDNFRRAQAAQRSTLAETKLAEHPRVRPWRDAYRAFGAKAKKYPSSLENLLRRVSAGATLRAINPLVDLYNTISLRHLLPAGGEDLDHLEGDLRLCFAGSDEAPVKLLGEPEARAPHPGEVIYKDSLGAVCRRWNWKEAERTKLTQDTTRAVLVLEALPPVTRDELVSALADLHGDIGQYCGGEIEVAVLHDRKSEFALA